MWHWTCVQPDVKNIHLGFIALASLLFLAGCEGIGEKEAQLEFERLRHRTITPQGDRVCPSFGIEPTSAEVHRRALEHVDRFSLRRDTSATVLLP